MIRKKILGVRTDFGLTIDRAVEIIDGLIKKREGSHLVATTSPYFVMSAQGNQEFKQAVNDSVLSVPDGVGMLYASYYLSRIAKLKRGALFPLKAFMVGIRSGLAGFTNKSEFGKTITGVALTYKLCELAAKNNYSVFFLGGRKRDLRGRQISENGFDMAHETAKTLSVQYPNLRIIGATSAFSRESINDNQTLSYIHNCMNRHHVNHIDILFVAYNPIGQELWIQKNANQIPSTISIGIGRTFNYITGDMNQPNTIYVNMHLSWLYTLIKQPWRVKRVLMTFPLFPIKVYLDSLKHTVSKL